MKSNINGQNDSTAWNIEPKIFNLRLFSLFPSRGKRDFSGSQRSRWQCRGKRDAYTRVYIYVHRSVYGERTYAGSGIAKTIAATWKKHRVYILRHLYKEVSYFAPDQTSIRASERQNCCCVHEGTIIAGWILKNPPCGNCRQITFSQFCEITRNSQCPCSRINESHRN